MNSFFNSHLWESKLFFRAILQHQYCIKSDVCECFFEEKWSSFWHCPLDSFSFPMLELLWSCPRYTIGCRTTFTCVSWNRIQRFLIKYHPLTCNINLNRKKERWCGIQAKFWRSITQYDFEIVWQFKFF